MARNRRGSLQNSTLTNVLMGRTANDIYVWFLGYPSESVGVLLTYFIGNEPFSLRRLLSTRFAGRRFEFVTFVLRVCL